MLVARTDQGRTDYTNPVGCVGLGLKHRPERLSVGGMPKRQDWDRERNAELREWLERMLDERGLNRADLQWMLGAYRRTSANTIDSWFYGKTVPSYPVLVALVLAFGELPPALQSAPLPGEVLRRPAIGEASQDEAGDTDGIGATG